MLVGENDLLRVTAPLFWMEWSDTSQGKNARRVGLLVNADESGRSGHIETFWEQDEGEPVYAQAIIEFDLNHEINLREPRVAFSIENSAHSLAPHVLYAVEDKWRDHFFYKGEEVGTKTVGTIVNSLLVGIEILFCFSVLLAERAGLQSHVINLSRLNAARTKKGRPPLLDHVEARIDLNIAIGLTGASSAFGSTRETEDFIMCAVTSCIATGGRSGVVHIFAAIHQNLSLLKQLRFCRVRGHKFCFMVFRSDIWVRLEISDALSCEACYRPWRP